MRLNNKTAIVTGGASGFGKGIVEKFIKEGANVVIADINYDLAKELEDSIGKNAFAVKVDVKLGFVKKSARFMVVSAQSPCRNARFNAMPSSIYIIPSQDFFHHFTKKQVFP